MHPKWRSRPLIGQVREKTSTTIIIRWWEGSYSSAWKPSKRREGRAFVEWVEEIPVENVVLETFSFSTDRKGAKQKIGTSLKAKLKAAYCNAEK